MSKPKFTIELCDPDLSRCRCCGGTTTRLTRFVYRDSEAYAVYYALFSERHAERAVSLAIGLGAWGEGTGPADRIAFAMKLRLGAMEFEYELCDPEASPWAHATIIGRMLDRSEALGHPLLKDAYRVTECAAVEDPLVRRFLLPAVA
jgi:hypothetical protein